MATIDQVIIELRAVSSIMTKLDSDFRVHLEKSEQRHEQRQLALDKINKDLYNGSNPKPIVPFIRTLQEDSEVHESSKVKIWTEIIIGIILMIINFIIINYVIVNQAIK